MTSLLPRPSAVSISSMSSIPAGIISFFGRSSASSTSSSASSSTFHIVPLERNDTFNSSSPSSAASYASSSLSGITHDTTPCSSTFFNNPLFLEWSQMHPSIEVIMDRAPVLQLTQKEICIIRMKHIGALIAQSYDPELVTHVFGCRPEVLASPESKTLAEFVEEELDEGEGVVEKLKGMIDLEGRATIDKFKVMLDAEIQAQVPATTDDDSAGGVGELNEIEKPSTRQVPTTWSIVQSLRKAMATDETPEVYAARRKENRNFSVFISPPGTPRGVRSKRSSLATLTPSANIRRLRSTSAALDLSIKIESFRRMSIVHDIDESGCTRRMSVVHDFDESDSIADSEPDHPFSMIQPHWSALYPDVKFERPPLPVIPQQIKEANPAYSGINTPRPPATTRPMIGTLTSPKTPKRSSARNILRHLSMSSRKPHKKEASKREKYAPMTTPPLAPRNSNSMDLSWRLSRDRKETVLIGARVEDLEQVPETPSRKMKGYIGRAKSIRWPNSPENHK